MHSIQDIRHSLEDDLTRFDHLCKQTLTSDNPLLNEVLVYIMNRRGKQIRPLLTMLSAKLCKGITDKTIQTAVAIELLHTASLVHDDVVDSSPKRRGMDAVQVKWSNKVAVLTGDFLLARVMELLAGLRNNRILGIVAQMSGQLSCGELLQLHANNTMWISEDQYNQVIEQKTARLFAACTEAGAESSGASMRQSTALREFGLHLGMCFQLKDDILDYSDSEELGKPTMNDIRDGKATLPLLVSVQRASKMEADHICALAEDLAHDAIDDMFAAEQEIKSFVLRYEGVRYAYQRMQEHKQQAIEALSCFHDSDTKNSLLWLVDYAINRIK